MTGSKEVRAAVGSLAIQATWLEFLTARLVAIAGDTTNEMALLAPRAEVFKAARDSAAAMHDLSVQQRTLAWLDRAETLRGERDKVIHSIVLHDQRPGWTGYHPRSGILQRLQTQDIVALAEQARQHAEEGVYMCVIDWPPAF